jgi:hypothetical protein
MPATLLSRSSQFFSKAAAASATVVGLAGTNSARPDPTRLEHDACSEMSVERICCAEGDLSCGL